MGTELSLATRSRGRTEEGRGGGGKGRGREGGDALSKGRHRTEAAWTRLEKPGGAGGGGGVSGGRGGGGGWGGGRRVNPAAVLPRRKGGMLSVEGVSPSPSSTPLPPPFPRPSPPLPPPPYSPPPLFFRRCQSGGLVRPASVTETPSGLGSRHPSSVQSLPSLGPRVMRALVSRRKPSAQLTVFFSWWWPQVKWQ